jgi:hypothetical protein
MKTLAMATATVLVLGGSAFAQGTGNLGAQPTGPMPAQGTVVDPNRAAPAFQQGSGQRAGGPANELNTTGSMGGPVTTGTIPGTPPAPSNPNDTLPSRQQTQGNVPVYQQGSGQQSGGPAKELNRQ